MKIYDFILQGKNSKSVAFSYAQDDFFCGMEYLEMNQPTHGRFIGSIRGVDVYYDHAADYWFYAIS